MSQTAGSFKHQKYDAGVTSVAMNLEVDVIPVSDVERSKQFYQHLGWRLDADDSPAKNVRIVQFTPPGSGCSVTFGNGLTAAAPGSAAAALIVSDIETAHDELIRRGIDASEIWHGASFPPEARLPGPDPKRTSHGSFFSFNDPDGNTWLVQEVTRRLPDRIDPATTTFASANDAASAMRRAAAAHGEREKRNGQRDVNWLDWMAYMSTEQVWEYMAAEPVGDRAADVNGYLPGTSKEIETRN
jgi:catechol 2,3-dioxygenase-like lactoylglutathione lyase family enzyme